MYRKLRQRTLIIKPGPINEHGVKSHVIRSNTQVMALIVTMVTLCNHGNCTKEVCVAVHVSPD